MRDATAYLEKEFLEKLRYISEKQSAPLITEMNKIKSQIKELIDTIKGKGFTIKYATKTNVLDAAPTQPEEKFKNFAYYVMDRYFRNRYVLGLEFAFRRIPAGSFLMGNSYGKKKTKIETKFEMAAFEVTRLQWYNVMGGQSQTYG